MMLVWKFLQPRKKPRIWLHVICFYCSSLAIRHMMFRFNPLHRGSSTRVNLAQQLKRRLFCVLIILDIPTYERWLIHTLLSSCCGLELPSRTTESWSTKYFSSFSAGRYELQNSLWNRPRGNPMHYFHVFNFHLYRLCHKTILFQTLQLSPPF